MGQERKILTMILQLSCNGNNGLHNKSGFILKGRKERKGKEKLENKVKETMERMEWKRIEE